MSCSSTSRSSRASASSTCDHSLGLPPLTSPTPRMHSRLRRRASRARLLVRPLGLQGRRPYLPYPSPLTLPFFRDFPPPPHFRADAHLHHRPRALHPRALQYSLRQCKPKRHHPIRIQPPIRLPRPPDFPRRRPHSRRRHGCGRARDGTGLAVARHADDLGRASAARVTARPAAVRVVGAGVRVPAPADASDRCQCGSRRGGIFQRGRVQRTCGGGGRAHGVRVAVREPAACR
ncbi:hypothetical protein B0H12DRAFT_326748 [Mycena haematopus]|nr:hypothetical protein B0H12DRAFT_326748 [Mycena haematopus]